jgi:hypothetical protein
LKNKKKELKISVLKMSTPWDSITPETFSEFNQLLSKFATVVLTAMTKGGGKALVPLKGEWAVPNPEIEKVLTETLKITKEKGFHSRIVLITTPRPTKYFYISVEPFVSKDYMTVITE